LNPRSRRKNMKIRPNFSLKNLKSWKVTVPSDFWTLAYHDALGV